MTRTISQRPIAAVGVIAIVAAGCSGPSSPPGAGSGSGQLVPLGFGGAPASAQGGPRFTAGDGISITGLSIAVEPCTNSGEAQVWNGTNFVCTHASTFLNSAGANVVMKSDGTNAVGSSITDNGAGYVKMSTGAGVNTILSWAQSGQAEWQFYEGGSSSVFKIWNSTAGSDVCTLSTAGLLNCVGGLSTNGTLDSDGITRVSKLGGNSTVGGLNVGQDTGVATDVRNGWSVTTYSDGNNYIDSKTFTGGHTYFRFGSGAASGAGGAWMTLDHATGLTTFPFAVTTAGNLTAGDSNTDVARVNGQLGVNDTPGAGYELTVLPSGGGTNTDVAFGSSDGKQLLFSVISGSTPVTIQSTNGYSINGSATFNNDLAVSGNLTAGDSTSDVFTSKGEIDAQNSIKLSTAGAAWIYSSLAPSAGDQDLYINAAGTGVVRINHNNGMANTGTGGLIVYGGANSATPAVTLAGNGNVTAIGNLTAGDSVSDLAQVNGRLRIDDDIGTGFGGSAGINILDTTAFAAGVGGVVYLGGKFSAGGSLADGAFIKGAKTNATDGNYSFDLVLGTTPSGGSPTERMRIKDTGAIQLGDTGSSTVENNVDVFTIGNTGTNMTSDVALVRATAPSWSFDLSSFATRTGYGGDFESSARGPSADCGGSPCYPSAGQMFNVGVRGRALGAEGADNIAGLFEAANGSSNLAIKATTGDVWLNYTSGITTIGAGASGDNLTVNGTTYITSTLQVDGNVTANGNVIVGNGSGDTLDMNGQLSTFGSTRDGLVYIFENEIDAEYATNNDPASASTGTDGNNATLYLGFSGYQHGSTRFRDTYIGNGKGAQTALFHGEDKSTYLRGQLNVTGHYVSASGAPTPSSCGGSPAVTGSDTDFKVVTGSAATGCVLTFASAFTTNAPVCSVTPADNTDVFQVSISTTALTLSSTPASATYYVHCGGWL